MIDPHFRVELIAQTSNPQQLIWLSAHQCVCEGAAIDDPLPTEENAGLYAVKHLLAGHRGHYSPLEAPQISFNVIGFNHRTMQQITRHRIGLHFSVQSLRYTSDRFLEVAKRIRGNPDTQKTIAAIESVVYLRPIGEYSDRSGKKYFYSESDRGDDLQTVYGSIINYAFNLEKGYSEEHAAGLLPMDTRQHWVMSANVRSLMHLLDLRAKADAQLEAQQLCELIWPHFQAWVPAIADWYEKNRLHKARLAP